MEQSKYRSYQAVHPFDEQYGVETGGLLYELPSGHPHDPYNNGYFAVAPSVFHAVLGMLKERLHVDFKQFSFVDIGSGKGRALLLASGYPFREIIGVELSEELNRIARANIAHYPRTQVPITSVHGDAASFEWPAGPLLVYVWNSFTQPVMEQILWPGCPGRCTWCTSIPNWRRYFPGGPGWSDCGRKK
jgi:SAM-dependent methyltransferase